MTIMITYIILSLVAILPPIIFLKLCGANCLSYRTRALSAYFMLFIILFGLGVLLLGPGGMTPDSESALRDARSGFWRGLQPHGLKMFFWVSEKIIPGPLPLVMFNIALVAAGTIGLFAISRPECINRNIVYTSLVFFFPATFTLLGMVWKDILNLSLYVVAACLSLAYRSIHSSRWRYVCLICCIILLAFGVFVRLNAPLAALPIVLFAFWPKTFKTKTQAITKIAVVIIFTVVSSVGLHKIHHTLSDTTFFMLASVKRYDLVWISYLSGENFLNMETWAAGLDEDSIKEICGGTRKYNYYSSAHYKLMFKFKTPWLKDPEHIKWNEEIAQRWQNAIIKYPSLWLRHKIRHFFGYLGVGMGPKGEASFTTNFRNYKAYDFKLVQGAFTRSFWQWFVKPVQKSQIMRPWVYWLGGVGILMSGILFRSKSSALAIMLVVSGLFMEIFYGVLVGAHYEYRWNHYFIYMCIVAFGLLIRDVSAGSKGQTH